MKLKDLPEFFRPYIFHGVDILEPDAEQAPTTCFNCGNEGHMHISQQDGRHHCKSCGQDGNISAFLHWLIDHNKATPADYKKLSDWKHISIPTLKKWKFTKSPLNGDWIIPAYNRKNDEGKHPLSNVYRYCKAIKKGKSYYRPMATATQFHQLLGLHFWKKRNKKVYIAEGVFDAPALWQTCTVIKYKDPKDPNRGFDYTTNPKENLLNHVNVIGVPGATVFRDCWGPIFKGMEVTLFYDNDYPRKNGQTGEIIRPASIAGMKRAVGIIAPYAKSVRIISWGEEGYTKDLPDGYDIRDALLVH